MHEQGDVEDPRAPCWCSRYKLFHKIQKLNEKSTEVQIIHKLSTEARPIHEDVIAETVGEASSAPTVDKKR